MEAEIILTYKSQREAEAVTRAVSPDNIKTPRNLHIKTHRTEKKVITWIAYKGKKLRTFASTIDDLLSCISVAEKAFIAVEKTKSSKP